MSFKAFLKNCIYRYFMITTFIAAAMGILGLYLDPTARIGYDGYFSPLLFGALSILPSVVTYSRKELSLRQALIRKLLYIILLEGMLIGVGFWVNILHGPGDASAFALTVLIVYLAVTWLNWRLDRKEADAINNELKAYQNR